MKQKYGRSLYSSVYRSSNHIELKETADGIGIQLESK